MIINDDSPCTSIL